MASKPERPRSPGRAWRKPGYWPCGVRGTGGVTLAWALVWNLRTCPAVVREKAQAVAPARLKVPMRQTGAHCPVVARMRGNARGAKGAGHSRPDRVGQLATGGTERLWRRAAALAEWHEPCKSSDLRTVL